MARANAPQWSNPPVILRYAVAVLSVVIVVILTQLPGHHLRTVSVLLCAIMLSAWFGGVGPGVLAILLSSLAFKYYFLEPKFSLALQSEDIPRFLVFNLSALFVVALSAAQRRSTESLRRARDEMRGTVEDLQQTNEALQKESVERKGTEGKLLKSQSYLSEAQRLTHAGSFGWKVSSGELVWSDETFRIFEYDRTTIPTVELVIQRTHPEDVAWVNETIQAAAHNGRPLDFEHRLLMPDGSVKHVHVVGHALSDQSSAVEFAGAVMDVTEQHQSRAALEKALDEIQKSQTRLRLVINTIPGMVWSGLPDGTFDFVNEPWLRYLGCSWEELSAQGGLRSVVHPDDLAGSDDRWATTRATGKHSDHELRMRGGNGQYRWFLTRALPLRDEAGNIVRWYGTATDIEDRKRAEMLLAGEKRLLEIIARGESRPLLLDALCRLVEELAPGCLASILLFDPNTNSLRHGSAPSLPPKYVEAIDGSVIGPSRGSCGTAAYLRKPVVVSDIAGDPLWAEFRDLALGHGLGACWSTPILSSAGEVLGTFAIYYSEPRSPTPQDSNVIEQITHLASIAIERAQATQALRQQANLLDQAHDAIIIWEFPGTIVYWNRGAEQLYGFSREEAIGRPSHEFLKTEHAMAKDEFEAALERDGEWAGELTHTTRDGRKIIVESRQVLMRETEGRRLVLETNRDITDRKLAEEALRQTQADLAHVSRVTTMGELVASIAHEVNQPLGAIVTNGSACVRLLSRDTPDVNKSREIIGRMINDGRRASEVIKRIRDLLHKTPTQKAPLNINDTVQEVIELVHSDIRRSKVELLTELEADVPPVVGDRIQLQQVILNLILNAKDAMSEAQPRELVITSRKNESGGVVVGVQDSGKGLVTKDAERIFDPFFTTKAEGMGLGLSISRRIIEEHGGRMWAIPNEPRGTMVQFTLPAESEEV